MPLADSLDRAPTPDVLAALAARGLLDERAYAHALALTGRRPGVSAWRRFLMVHLLFLAVAALAASAAFFVLAGYRDLSRVERLLLVGVPQAALALGAVKVGLDRLPGRGAAILATLLTGPLLILFGESYPRGATAFELFVAWSALHLAFTVSLREPALVIVQVALLDLTLLAWQDVVLGRRLDHNEGLAFALSLAGLHALAIAAHEVLSARGFAAFRGRALPRVLALTALGFAVAHAVLWIVEARARVEGRIDVIGPAMLVVALAGAAALAALHRRRIPDLFQLSMAGATVATLAAFALGRLLFGAWDMEIGGALLEGAFIVGAMTLLGRWLLAWRAEHRILEGGAP